MKQCGCVHISCSVLKSKISFLSGNTSLVYINSRNYQRGLRKHTATVIGTSGRSIFAAPRAEKGKSEATRRTDTAIAPRPFRPSFAGAAGVRYGYGTRSAGRAHGKRRRIWDEEKPGLATARHADGSATPNAFLPRRFDRFRALVSPRCCRCPPHTRASRRRTKDGAPTASPRARSGTPSPAPLPVPPDGAEAIGRRRSPRAPGGAPSSANAHSPAASTTSRAPPSAPARRRAAAGPARPLTSSARPAPAAAPPAARPSERGVLGGTDLRQAEVERLRARERISRCRKKN